MRISEQKKEKICEQLLAHLYAVFPRSLFTATLARELARDEEFIKKLLEELQRKKLVAGVHKNKKGILYQRRKRWQLSPLAQRQYQLQQSTSNTLP